MDDSKENIYQIELKKSVHFSIKTINSNAESGGIRLSKSQELDLPYISARTLLNEGLMIPTDYQGNAQKARVFKVIKAMMLNEDISKQELDFQQQVVKLTPELATLFDKPYQENLSYINPRVRQLLIPKNGKYLSISPISSAGVNYLFNQEVDDIEQQIKEKDADFHNLQMAVFGIGGSNPQNVGGLVREMQRPIVLSAPKIDNHSRQALAIFYRGFHYYINKDLLTDWANLLNIQLDKTAKNPIKNWHEKTVYSPSSDMKVRAKEKNYLQNIVKSILRQGDFHRQNLMKCVDILPSLDELPRQSFWSSPEVDYITQGLIEPKLRDDSWRHEFAKNLAQRIIIGKIQSDDNQLVSHSLDDNARYRLIRYILEELS